MQYPGLTSRLYTDPAPRLRANLDLNGKNVGSASATEIGYLSGVTSAIQTQFTAKQPPYYLIAANDSPAYIKAVAHYTCDGTADEAQINAAIEAAYADNGSTIMLSSGTFYIAAPILVRGGLRLTGQGWYSDNFGTKLKLVGGANCNVIEPKAASAAYFWLTDMHIDGNKYVETTNESGSTSGHGISDANGRAFGADFRMDRCLVNHFPDNCINLTNSATLRHLAICQSTIEYADDTCLHVVISDDAGHKLQLNAVDIEAAGSPAKAMHIEGFNASGRGRCSMTNVVVSLGDTELTDFRDLAITGCYFRHTYLTSCDDTLFSGNRVDGDLSCEYCDDISITGNNIDDEFLFLDTNGSTLNSQVTITGNQVGSYADLKNLRDFTMTGNMIKRFVQIRNCQRGVIAHNSLASLSTETNAIYFGGGDASDYLIIGPNMRTQTDAGESAIAGYPTSGTHNILIDSSAGSMRIPYLAADKLGFWNTTPVAKQVLATGSDTDAIITALQGIGLFKQS